MIRNEAVRFKLTRQDVEYAEIFADGAPTLRMSGNSEIKCSLQGEFLEYAVDAKGRKQDINWLTDEIKPYLVFDGVEYPLGVLLPASVTPKKDKGKTTLSVEAYDRCWRVRDTKVESRVYFASGTKYTEALGTLLATCGIAKISVIDTDSVFSTARDDWETGTSYLKIINGLLNEINYNELWFDENGVAIIEPASVALAKNLKHQFTSKKPDPKNSKEISMIGMYPRISKTTDIYQKPNVFICICSNPEKTSDMSSKAENINPESPLSIPRRGRRIVSVEKINNIPDQAALDKYAERKLMDSMVTGEVIDFETALQPGFGVNDVCSISYEDVSGVCIEREWSMNLSPGGVMSHKLERVVVNIG